MLLELRHKGRYLDLFAVVAEAVPRHKLRLRQPRMFCVREDPVICRQSLPAPCPAPAVSRAAAVERLLQVNPVNLGQLISQWTLALRGTGRDPVGVAWH